MDDHSRVDGGHALSFAVYLDVMNTMKKRKKKKARIDRQGHLTVEPNVVIISGRRYCLACMKAKFYFRGHITEDFYSKADEYYEEIMRGVNI